MACSCDSCSSPRIIKTRTATFWRWLAQSRGETADRVIPAPARTLIASRASTSASERPDGAPDVDEAAAPDALQQASIRAAYEAAARVLLPGGELGA